MKPNTLSIIEKIWEFRNETSIPVCFTMDAGPNIHLLYPHQYHDQVLSFINSELLKFTFNNTVIHDKVDRDRKIRFMISEKGSAFNSKILLFGEYSLIKGSMALSIPNNKLSGQLLFDASLKNQRSNHYSLVYLLEYLNFLEKNDFTDLLNVSEFKTDIENGLYFECNIPISYGLGSSGAIVASIFDAYSLMGKVSDFSELKSIFSRMESFYHGKSSGLDPLVSYLDKAILMEEDGKITNAEIPKFEKQNMSGIFLIDTKTTGEHNRL